MDDVKFLDRETTSHICGVEVSKVRVEVLAKHLGDIGFAFDTRAPVATMVERYADWFATSGAKECSPCDVCGGVSDARLEACPYCGDAGAIEGEIVNPVALAVVAPTPLAPADFTYDKTEAGLDQALQETYRLKAAIVTGHWHLGKHLHGIHTTKLWQERKGPDGMPRHKSFGAFCREEVNMTDDNVMRLIDVALQFDEQTAGALGAEKLALVLRAPEGSRPKLLQSAKKGASLRALRKDLAESKAEYKSATGQDFQRGSAETGRTVSNTKISKGRAREMVTLVEIQDDRVLQLYSRTQYVATGDLVPTKNIDDAVAFHYLVNDVVIMHQYSRDSNGNIVTKTTLKRQ